MACSVGSKFIDILIWKSDYVCMVFLGELLELSFSRFLEGTVLPK